MNDEIITILSETFEGPEGNGSWFTESKPGSGLFGTIDRLSYEEASILIEGVTIAAHTDHTRYHLWANNQVLEGKTQELNWKESWQIGAVTKDEWEQIKKGLHYEYMTMTEHLNDERNLDSPSTTSILGTIAHAAYHLGAIRQMVKVVEKHKQKMELI